MLAIIIPYYKITFFEETLQALADQTDKRFNVYIGNDASPNDCLSLLEKFKSQFNFLYKRFENNLGGISLVKQWERCIAMTSEEEWMMILGDDDTLSIDCVKDFYANISDIVDNNCNVIRYATIINDLVQEKMSSLYTHPKLEKATDFFYRRFTDQTRSSLSEYIFKRTAYRKHGFFDYELGWYSDDRAWLEFSEFEYIYSINSSHVSFRLSKENISRANYKIKEKQRAAFEFFNFLIFEHFNKFKRYQRKDLLMYYEQLIYKNKKASFSFWLSLFLLFLGSYYVIQSIKFTRRLLIHINKDA